MGSKGGGGLSSLEAGRPAMGPSLGWHYLSHNNVNNNNNNNNNDNDNMINSIITNNSNSNNCNNQLLVSHYLSNTTSFVLCAAYNVKEHPNLLHYSPRLKKTCARQVVLDKWLPLYGYIILYYIYTHIYI